MIQMGKSVYSLVLMDEVVDAIDQMAYRNNTSRSNLINQILAEHVSLATPEKRMKDVFTSLEQFMDEQFQIQFMPSDSMLSIRSPLRYKYKPTIRYSVELYRNPGSYAGRLKVQFRTQNLQLIRLLQSFFEFWISSLEGKYLPGRIHDSIRYELNDGRFSRELFFPPEEQKLTSEEFGNSIAEYIQLLDSMIKEYFAGLDDLEAAAGRMEKEYIAYLNEIEKRGGVYL